MLPQEKRAGQMNLDSIQSLDTFMQNIRTGEIWATASKLRLRIEKIQCSVLLTTWFGKASNLLSKYVCQLKIFTYQMKLLDRQNKQKKYMILETQTRKQKNNQ